MNPMLGLDMEAGIPILLILILVLFGGAKIPSLMRNLGAAKSEFNKGMAEGTKEDADGKSEKSEKKD